jgi:hypothetical protein
MELLKRTIGENSTRILISSSKETAAFDFFRYLYPGNTKHKFMLTEPGKYTINFEKLPPPIPSEYWMPL